MSRMVVRAGIGAWCMVGIVIVVGLVCAGLAAVSSVVMPLVFAAMLAVVFRPSVRWLEARRVPSPVAAGGVVVALVAAVGAVAVATVEGLLDQTQRIGDLLGPALDHLDVDAATAQRIRQAIDEISPSATAGMVRSVVGGVSALGGLIAGAVLGVLTMYYLLRDGDAIRDWAVRRTPVDERDAFDGFLEDATIVLRRYARGRAVLSAIVAGAVGLTAVVLGLPLVLTLVVVNFVGGFVPYIGAVVGGALAVMVALAEGGSSDALAMLAVVLVANLLLENLLEPKVMGRSLAIHPVVVLIVTAVGGIVGGLVGLMLAVPITVILISAFHRAQSVDALTDAADRAMARLSSFRRPAGASDRAETATTDAP